jgi:hypothetical protein
MRLRAQLDSPARRGTPNSGSTTVLRQTASRGRPRMPIASDQKSERWRESLETVYLSGARFGAASIKIVQHKGSRKGAPKAEHFRCRSEKSGFACFKDGHRKQSPSS